jgi:hypothetical protein
MWESLSDDSDTTYIYNSASTTYAEVEMGAFTLDPATYDVTATIRMQGFGDSGIMDVGLFDGDDDQHGSTMKIPVSTSDILNYTCTWESLSLTNGDLSNLRLRLATRKILVQT